MILIPNVNMANSKELFGTSNNWDFRETDSGYVYIIA